MNGIVDGILSDCIGLKGVPTGTASAALGKLINKRHKMLREVILSEIRQGNFDNVDEDELVSIFFRLIRDAEEGTARNNLRLMARVANGMAEKQELKAPSFLKYVNILASLTEEEITVLGIMARYIDVNDKKGRNEELENEVVAPESALQSLMRTGLIRMDTNTYYNDRKSNVEKYDVTPLMAEILRYVPHFNGETK